jgi:hypothetical protein
MFRFVITLVAAAALLGSLAGCCSVRDARGPSSICEVHNRPMRSEVIRESGGDLVAPPSYKEARAELFPHAYPHQSSSPWPWKLQRIFVCDDCVCAEDRWLHEHQPTTPHPHFRSDTGPSALPKESLPMMSGFCGQDAKDPICADSPMPR